MKLIIAEKPSVAKEIAKVVGANQYSDKRDCLIGNGYMVSWCFGHLIEMAVPEEYGEVYAKWTLDTLPIIPKEYITMVSASKAQQFAALKRMMASSEVTELIEATDAGREGELIFRLVYYQAGCRKPFKRLWISSLEEKSIREGLADMKDGSAYDSLYAAALCRQRADWLVGINFTRLYTVMYQRKLTCGRVQTPTICMLVERQREIQSFVPQPYYTLTAPGITPAGQTFKAYARVDSREEAQEITAKCSGGEGIIEKVESREKEERAEALFDLTTLQREANRLLGYTAKQTLDYAQSLYEKKLMTYPRTDSRYITAAQGDSTRQLLTQLLSAGIFTEKINKEYQVSQADVGQLINDAKVSDHHALLPTASVTPDKLAELPGGERNILFMVAYRLLSAAYKPYRYQTTKVDLTIADTAFSATGRVELDPGFRLVRDQMKHHIKSAAEETPDSEDSSGTLPPMAVGDTFTAGGVTAEEKHTKPPKPYTEDKLLQAMETAGRNIEDPELKEAMKDSGLGTPATRAGIIENIIKTGYVVREGKKLLPTDVAYTFIDLVAEKLKKPELTAEWEKELAAIHKAGADPDAFMGRITSFVMTLMEDAKSGYVPEADSTVFRHERESIGVCPRCGKNVVEYPKSFSCESGKEGCGFTIWKKIAGKTVSAAQAKKLLDKRRSDLMKGFTSKAGKKFDAYLILKDDNSVGFDFPKKG